MTKPSSPNRYTHGHHASVLRSHTWRTVENSAGYLVPHLRPGASLLDVGCGPGTITVDFAARLSPGRVVGIDPAADVIAQASALDGAARFEVGDVLSYADAARFDIVHAHQVLQHVADPVGALRGMARLAAPGGLVAARDADYRAFIWYPLLPELDRWMEIYQRVARSNQGEPDAGRYLLAWAHAAGFDDVEYTTSQWTVATPADREWWGGMWADRIVQSALANQAVTDGVATRAELDEISAAWRRWVHHPDAVFVIPHGEILCRVAG